MTLAELLARHPMRTFTPTPVLRINGRDSSTGRQYLDALQAGVRPVGFETEDIGAWEITTAILTQNSIRNVYIYWAPGRYIGSLLLNADETP